jgi:hypothetical protein
MSRHVRSSLYDYVSGSLSPEETAAIEGHLRRCRSCSADVDSVRETMRLLSGKNPAPADMRDEAFWSELLDTVDRRIRVESAERTSWFEAILAHTGTHPRRRIALALGGTGTLAIAALLVFLLWPRQSRLPAVSPETRTTDQTAEEAPEIVATRRLNEYFRKSKVIMVGLANRKESDPRGMDLSQEREQSRTLVREARELRRYPLDRRSDRLVGDVQKIMIGLSNLNESQKAPGVDILLSGIRRENLLFRVRMAENFTNVRSTEGTLQ